MTANLQLCTHKSACLRRLKCSPPTAPLSRRASENSANTAFRAFVPTPRISFRGKHICRNGGSFFEDQDLSASEEKEIPPPEPVLPPGVLFMEGNENNIIRVVDIPVDAGIALAGTLGWLGLGAGTGAHLINKYFPQQRQELSPFEHLPAFRICLLRTGDVRTASMCATHTLEAQLSDMRLQGWELDGTVLEASRKFMGLAELESGDNPLEVHVSNAFEACVEGGFSGLIVDLF
eukprot:gene19089-22823_t